MPLALYTFGMFARRADHPANDGVHALNDPVFARVDRAEGLIARSGYASDPGPESWGPEVYPRFHEERGDGWAPATLSLWTELEAPWAFTYSGLAARRGDGAGSRLVRGPALAAAGALVASWRRAADLGRGGPAARTPA